MADPDMTFRWGGGGVVGGQSQKNFFGPFGPQLIWSKNKGPLGGLPWIRHWIFPPNVAYFFLSVNSVRIGQNLLNELPIKKIYSR